MRVADRATSSNHTVRWGPENACQRSARLVGVRGVGGVDAVWFAGAGGSIRPGTRFSSTQVGIAPEVDV
jgi:hypothetical protein